MKEIGIVVVAVTIAACALASCTTAGGPFASTRSTQLVVVDRFHGTMRPCGPDRHVCFEMQRDDTDRQHGN